VRTGNLEVHFTPSAMKHARVAIVVPRHRQSIVKRNRVRRLIREHLRLALLRELPTVDVVVRALPGAYATNAATLRSELSDMARRVVVSTE
jgi:ribonuclease P protein component